ncbi:MAG TPA: DUF190 domain-containing protein [Rectinemataceae bacterium]|nr:DUF190 domain-containing protein [Rectinemataceae bacterium]
MTDYRVIRIYTREKARFEGKALGSAIVGYIRSLRIAARCVALRGVEGLYESGESVSGAIVEGSYDLPLVIDIVLPAAEAEAVLARLEVMVTDGFISVSGARVTSFRAPSGPLPAHLLVKDIMTAQPLMAHPDFSVRSAVELLLDRDLKSLPVVDAREGVVGIVTQRDLMRKASMPLRLGLLGSLDESLREAWLVSMERLPISAVMTAEPKTIREDQDASTAIHFMARARMKRLPVVDAKGGLVGMLSRIDVLRAIARQRGPAPAEFADRLPPSGARIVADIEERDSLALDASATLREATEALARDSAQRAAVVDAEGRLLGLVTDKILFEAIDRAASGFRRLFPGMGQGRRVSDIMLRDIAKIGEGAGIGEALRLMTERGLKRIPVVDAEGRFRGMVRRDTILLALTGDL